ncbi:MAG: class I SAM-dependent methyltransferase [Chloroflexi bacterium]|nr:class I SAM-dependent methyltransferase [Chloroflexota bacterium]
MKEFTYSNKPQDAGRYTEKNDSMYTMFAGFYNWAVKALPVWKNWITSVIPHIQGPRVLEASFGTGYLLMQYADRFDTFGIDYNEKMLSIARNNLDRKGITARLEQANVESLPYEDEMFDSIVNTMAFSGYPNEVKAMSELHRVLKKGGRLLLVDINYPANRNWLGMGSVKFWASAGDIIRDMGALFEQFDFTYTDEEIGGFGCVHLYVAEKV